MKTLKNYAGWRIAGLSALALLVWAGAGCRYPIGQNATESIRPANETASDLIVNQTPVVTPVTTGPSEVACKLIKPRYDSPQPWHQAVLKYFDAINHQDYEAAFSMLADNARARYASQTGELKQNFIDFFTKNVTCIQVTGLSDVTDQAKCPMMSTSLGIQCYQVELEYYPPAGTANPVKVPTIYTVLSDLPVAGDQAEKARIINIQD